MKFKGKNIRDTRFIANHCGAHINFVIENNNKYLLNAQDHV